MRCLVGDRHVCRWCIVSYVSSMVLPPLLLAFPPLGRVLALVFSSIIAQSLWNLIVVVCSDVVIVRSMQLSSQRQQQDQTARTWRTKHSFSDDFWRRLFVGESHFCPTATLFPGPLFVQLGGLLPPAYRTSPQYYRRGLQGPHSSLFTNQSAVEVLSGSPSLLHSTPGVLVPPRGDCSGFKTAQGRGCKGVRKMSDVTLSPS
jgi:lipid-A-disaccharide synthase-like uncharacterized protein